MKRAFAASLLALAVAGTLALAGGYADAIRQSYLSAGYSNVEVREVNGKWLVTADKSGRQVRFIVDPKTGQSTEVTDGSPDAALFDGAGATATAGTGGGLVVGGVSAAVSGRNTGNVSSGDDDSEHGESDHDRSGEGSDD